MTAPKPSIPTKAAPTMRQILDPIYRLYHPARLSYAQSPAYSGVKSRIFCTVAASSFSSIATSRSTN